jgi:hypothetical protein
MNNDLKGITYASQPQIGIPMAESMLQDSDPENRLSAAVYLGYRLLDKTYTNTQKYDEILNRAISDSKLIGNQTVSGYRWFLSLALLRSYIDITLKDPPQARTDILQEAYDAEYVHENQICNISKIAVLLYYSKNKCQNIKQEATKRINKVFEKPENIEQMSSNTIKDLLLPLLSDKNEHCVNAIQKYKNWYIHKDYIRLLQFIIKNQKSTISASL